MTPASRPHLAIIGGGGAMGRLFTRLFCAKASELYAIDFFDAKAGSSSLQKLLDDVRGAGETGGFRLTSYSLARRDDAEAWSLTVPSFATTGRSATVLTSDGTRGPALAAARSDQNVPSLAALADLLGEAQPNQRLVMTCLPEDAFQVLPRVDIILLAIGIEGRSSFTEAVRSYAPFFQPGSLVVDLGSTQSQPLEILAEIVDRRVGLLGAHPLFGPTVSDLTGLIVAVADPPDARPRSPWQPWFLDALAELRFIVTPTSAEDHDDAMSFVQALTHFTLLSFAYTFVRLNRDPADLLALRTPVFEPLLYLAARVAHLARSSPDTYRAIQTHTARPETRTAFLEAAQELLAAIEQIPTGDAPVRPATESLDRLAAFFQRYGAPWSPERRDRRERQRREHFLEMGARLVDGLNQLRQEVIASAGEVRAVEERRVGQPPRICVGVVDLDLLDPGKQDIASRIRLRPVNLLLGSVQGTEGQGQDVGHDYVIPLARARLLGDDELLDWLFAQNELVEWRHCDLLVPAWFDRQVLLRLVKGLSAGDSLPSSRVWDVAVESISSGAEKTGDRMAARISLAIVLHPAEIVAIRRQAEAVGSPASESALRDVEDALDAIRREIDEARDPIEVSRLQTDKDRLKHQRKSLLDQRTTTLDREVRRLTRTRVHAIHQAAIQWLISHGCTPRR